MEYLYATITFIAIVVFACWLGKVLDRWINPKGWK